MSKIISTERLIDPSTKLARKILSHYLKELKYGTLKIEFDDGCALEMSGADKNPNALMRIHEPMNFIWRILIRGEIGFAESYMKGEWDTPELNNLLYFCELNEEAISELGSAVSVYRLLNRLQHLLKRNHRRGSRRNISQHYDLGNRFYRQWLDRSMTYSCAIFKTEGESLQRAQLRKNQRILESLEAHPGQHILEIGCGWGGFAEFAAKNGYRVTGVTLSQEQHSYAQRRIANAGLDARVELRIQDYRDIRGKFDHIVSIEMFEAVGEEYWPTFLQTLKRRLRPGGRIGFQAIMISDHLYEAYRIRPDFIQLYIFPGGMLASPSMFWAHAKRAGVVPRSVSFRGHDYAQTLRCWQQNLKRKISELSSSDYSDSFIRMWQYYLAYCEAGFRSGRVDLMQTVMEHND